MPDSKSMYLELQLVKSVETDKKGNWIIEGEASNENLDFQEQEVLQEALLSSKEYFLENGIISYDHRHNRPDPDDPNWNPEKYIIGEPLDVYTKGNKTYVKAKLYRNNDIAKEIVSKLESGSTRIKASVGGRQPVVEERWDEKLKRRVEKVVAVLWDELAITFKPVNQTMEPWALSSAEFVKSLQAGYGTDSALKTGGGALVPEDLMSGLRDGCAGLIEAMACGDIGSEAEAIEYLTECGYSRGDARGILHDVVSNRKRIMEEYPMDEELKKSFEDSMLTLEKSAGGKSAADKKEEDADSVLKSGETDGDVEEENGGDETADGDEEKAGAAGKAEKEKECRKSVDNALPAVERLNKAVERQQKQIEELLEMQKSIAAALCATGKIVKSIAESPKERQAVLQKSERTFLSAKGEKTVMSRNEILAKSSQLVREGKMSMNQASIIEERLNKGIEIPDSTLAMIKTM